jgi:hypothetical protein
MAEKSFFGMAALLALFVCILSGYSMAQSAGESAYIEGTISHVEAGVDMGPVGGANLTITCLNNSVSVFAVSVNDGCDSEGGPFPPCGTYSVVHPDCAVGSKVEVSAVKGVLLGSNTNTVSQFYNYVGVGVSWIDVEIAAPEIVGALLIALLSAPGIAYIAARKKEE